MKTLSIPVSRAHHFRSENDEKKHRTGYVLTTVFTQILTKGNNYKLPGRNVKHTYRRIERKLFRKWQCQRSVKHVPIVVHTCWKLDTAHMPSWWMEKQTVVHTCNGLAAEYYSAIKKEPTADTCNDVDRFSVMEGVSLGKLHTVWFRSHDVLEKAKRMGWKTNRWLPAAEAGETLSPRAPTRAFLGW